MGVVIVAQQRLVAGTVDLQLVDVLREPSTGRPILPPAPLSSCQSMLKYGSNWESRPLVSVPPPLFSWVLDPQVVKTGR